MIRLASVLADHLDAGSMESLVGIETMLDERTFVTHAGDLFTVLRAVGPDSECLDPAQIDQVARRVEAATRSIGPEFRINQYRIKRTHPGLPVSHYADPVVEQAVASRNQHLAKRLDSLFTFETYFVIGYLGWRSSAKQASSRSPWKRLRSAIRQPISSENTKKSLEEALERAAGCLKEAVDAFVIHASDAIALSVASSSEAFGLFRRLLNYDPVKSECGRLRVGERLPRQIADSTVECYRDHLRVDDQYVQVLTLKVLPPTTIAHLLRELETLDAPFIIATEWQPLDKAAARSLIQSKRRHFHTARTSLASHLASSNANSKDLLVDDAADAVVGELGECLRELDIGGKTLGAFSLTVVIHARDLDRVRRASAQCMKVFAGHDARVVEERYNLLNAWLAIVPGNDTFNLRRLWTFDRNYADLSLLFEQHTGELVNHHLHAEYLAIFETDGGVPFFFNLHHQDVGHTLVLGATGAGKSFLLNFLITNLKKYDPEVFIFDIGHGYEALTQLCGGGYTSLAHRSRGSINPFSLPHTPENLNFLAAFCRVLIETSGYTMTGTDEDDLYEQIDNVYSLEDEQRRLKTLSQLTNRNLRAQLAKWVQGGQFAEWFDNVADTVSLRSFQTLDFEGLHDFPQVLEALVFYVLHRANAALTNPGSSERLKLLVLDEAWRFVRHPAIRAYVVEALKTWRKKNAAVLLATQSVDDLEQSELLSVVLESCPTKLFLANAGMDVGHYQALFRLNHTEAARIASLTPKRQFLMKRPDLAKVLTLNVDAKSYWLYTNNPTENAARQDAFNRYGLQNGLDYLVRRSS